MATKDELHTLAMSLLDNAKDDLARDGSVMNTHILLKRNGQKVCIADAGVDKDAMGLGGDKDAMGLGGSRAERRRSRRHGMRVAARAAAAGDSRQRIRPFRTRADVEIAG